MEELYTRHTPPSERVKQPSFSTTTASASASNNPFLFILGSRNGGALPPQARKQQLIIHSVCSNLAINSLITIIIITQRLTRRPMNNKTIPPASQEPTKIPTFSMTGKQYLKREEKDVVYLEKSVPQAHSYSRVPQTLTCAFQSVRTAYHFEHLSHFHFFSPCFRL